MHSTLWGEMPEGSLASVTDEDSPTPAEDEYWSRDEGFSQSRKLELGGTRTNVTPLKILWDFENHVGKDAWFPTVCEIGIRVIILKSQWTAPQLPEDMKTYTRLTLDPEDNK